MFVAENGKVSSRFVGCFGVMLAIAVGIGCSSDPPAAAGATGGGSNGQGGSTSATGGMDNDGSSGLDAPDWAAACEAVTPPAPPCPCICRNCAEVTARCFGNPDCQPIVDCAQRTGCRSSAECLGSCTAEIAAHMAGVNLALNFQGCFNPMCASVCILPDASSDSSDGAGGAPANDAAGEAGAD
jgi:hypothetical protein